MKRKGIAWGVGWAIVLAGCSTGKPLRSEPPHNNKTYTVQYLFEHDGCRVYRFYDDGGWVYFTNCTGSTYTKKDSTARQNVIRRRD